MSNTGTRILLAIQIHVCLYLWLISFLVNSLLHFQCHNTHYDLDTHSKKWKVGKIGKKITSRVLISVNLVHQPHMQCFPSTLSDKFDASSLAVTYPCACLHWLWNDLQLAATIFNLWDASCKSAASFDISKNQMYIAALVNMTVQITRFGMLPASRSNLVAW